jgi:kynurenine formamidase
MEMEQIFHLASNLRTYDLEQPRYFGAPTLPAHEPGFVYTLHRRHEPDQGEARTGASGFIYTAEHSGTHIDALSHQAENLYLYGKQKISPKIQTSTGFTTLGVETITPIVSRGVLLDVAKYRGVEWIETDHPITRADLEETRQQQGVTIQPGDVVTVRTGNGARWKDPTAYLKAGGISADASQWLADQQVKAVGADNVAWDTLGVHHPEYNATLPGHLILLARYGIYIIENLFLEDLAQDNIHEFLFICLPLKVQGGTGSPVRPIALAPKTE